MSYKNFSEFGDHPRGYKKLYDLSCNIFKTAPIDKQVVEVGVRSGGSALTLLNAIKDTNPSRYLHTIDPHGSKPYLSRDMQIPAMYNDQQYRETMNRLSGYCLRNHLNWAHWKMKSLEWCAMYPNIEFWSDQGQLKDEFCFVHLDGDHTTNVVADELAWFVPRTRGVIIVDDVDQIDVSDERIRKHKGRVEDNYLIITC